MLAVLTLAGMAIRKAGATKNILAAIMNMSAVLIFVLSSDVGWVQVAASIVGSLCGGWIGVSILHKVNEKILRLAVVGLGAVLTIAMFII